MAHCRLCAFLHPGRSCCLEEHPHREMEDQLPISAFQSLDPVVTWSQPHLKLYTHLTSHSLTTFSGRSSCFFFPWFTLPARLYDLSLKPRVTTERMHPGTRLRLLQGPNTINGHHQNQLRQPRFISGCCLQAEGSCLSHFRSALALCHTCGVFQINLQGHKWAGLCVPFHAALSLLSPTLSPSSSSSSFETSLLVVFSSCFFPSLPDSFVGGGG